MKLANSLRFLFYLDLFLEHFASGFTHQHIRGREDHGHFLSYSNFVQANHHIISQAAVNCSLHASCPSNDIFPTLPLLIR